MFTFSSIIKISISLKKIMEIEKKFCHRFGWLMDCISGGKVKNRFFGHFWGNRRSTVPLNSVGLCFWKKMHHYCLKFKFDLLFFFNVLEYPPRPSKVSDISGSLYRHLTITAPVMTSVIVLLVVLCAVCFITKRRSSDNARNLSGMCKYIM